MQESLYIMDSTLKICDPNGSFCGTCVGIVDQSSTDPDPERPLGLGAQESGGAENTGHTVRRGHNFTSVDLLPLAGTFVASRNREQIEAPP
jgi:hypothetical protein